MAHAMELAGVASAGGTSAGAKSSGVTSAKAASSRATTADEPSAKAASAGAETRHAGYSIPGEYEPHAAVWLAWPTFQWFSAAELDTRRTVAEILQILADRGVPAKLMCENEREVQAARRWLARNGYPVGPGVGLVPIPADDIWVRDYGPIFLKNPATGRLAIVSYRQNQWGYSTVNDPLSVRMTELPDRVARYLGNERVLRTGIVSEGGNRICNGDGVLLVNRTLEMQRNPGTPWKEIEAAHRRSLGVTRVIGLNGGLREDLQANTEAPIPYFHADEIIRLYGAQTTGGHADEFCQFAGPNRIVLAEVTEREAAGDPIMAANYARLQEVVRTLREQTDAHGNPFEVVRLPVPDIDYMRVGPGEPMYSEFLARMCGVGRSDEFPEGKPVHIVKCASYVNYLATNGVVIAPRYGNAEKDDAVARILQAAYDRDVVQIDPTPINYIGGGIHCVTQQEPVSCSTVDRFT